MSMAEALQTFFAEARGLLLEMEEALLKLEDEPGDQDALNAVFRAAHTIKGSAGLFGLDGIVAFTHTAESVLDLARDGKLPVDDRLTGLFLECRDHIERLLDLATADAGLDDETRDAGAALSERLATYLGASDGDKHLPEEAVSSVERIPGSASDDNVWHISLRFARDVLQNGMDPLSFIRYLATIGDVLHVTTLPDALPPAAEMNPELCYLGFEVRLRSDADKSRIENVFEFVREGSAIRILPPGSRIQDYQRLIEDLPEDNLRLGDLLVASGAVTRRELEEALSLQSGRQARGADDAALLGNVLVSEQVVQPEVVDAALNKQKEARSRQSQESKLLRVHADKLDSLINLVGELVIAGAGLGMLAAREKDAAMVEAVSGVARLVEEIRDGAMRLRMVEIGETFNRFRRVVRDVCKETGKDIELVINGADTELDKTVVDRIGDPLTHLVRNAVDHGIESSALRAERGKPAQGTVSLNACHESGGIVIEVADDGGGLNRDKILAKARSRGLIAEGQELADADVWNLIFEPGFSTADQVSNLSGRGVGMDVVKRSIEALRGTVEIESRAGRGSIFRIRLPLSLAIIDGFLMSVADGHFVVPLDMVLECVELNGKEAANGRDYIDLRGEVLPLLRLKDHFALEGPSSRRRNVVVVHWGGRKAGLVVDELKGELQAVIKPLGQLFSGLRGLSGSTILGSGEVALVLDVPMLLEQALLHESRQLNPLQTDRMARRNVGVPA
ncbi:MAG: chemotaxis protein CheA [Chromatiales bacterium]|jgi:two-component system chemotaxis sensor kinase CheA|nr:chemotaxis protein CheA [Chromatiales bacterium]MDX9767061.1 chemotaxis protein CheA [Ectothiorhodospiraceae bacterium]